MFPEPRFINANGIKIAVYEQKPPDGSAKVPIVFCHGFPELAFSWRHQFPVLCEAGYHVIASDQRGYGHTTAPPEITDYDIEALTADIIGMLDGMEIEKAVFVGHDWGALVMWSLPFLYPERVLGLCGLNVPFMPRGSIDPLSAMVAAFGPNHYINYFQKPGAAEALFEQDFAKSHRFFMRKVNDGSAGEKPSDEYMQFMREVALQKLFLLPESEWHGQDLLSDQELAYYVSRFKKSGYRGPINWYRNFERNWRYMADFQPKYENKPLIDCPVLMITAEKDAVLPPRLAEPMPLFCSHLSMHLIEGCGHWTQQEKPEQVNQLLLDWLSENFSTG